MVRGRFGLLVRRSVEPLCRRYDLDREGYCNRLRPGCLDVGVPPVRISEKKSPPPAGRFNVIGVSLDLRPCPSCDALVNVTESRLSSIKRGILGILHSDRMGSGLAASLSGKLGFTITATFGKVGRARIRPFINRAYSRKSYLTPHIRSCLRWWLRFLRIYRPRPVPSSLLAMPTIISYSDGEGGSAGVGVAAWVPWLSTPVAAFCMVPDEVRSLWAKMAGKLDYRDIYLIEAVGPLILLMAFPRIMRNVMWIHFIDNESAESALISGSSSLLAADHVVGLTWEICSERTLYPYFDRVASADNPVDALSRGDMSGPWTGVERVAFPTARLMELANECNG